MSRPRPVASGSGDLRREVLLTGVTPYARTAALVGKLAAVDAAPAALETRDRATRKTVSRRVARLADYREGGATR